MEWVKYMRSSTAALQGVPIRFIIPWTGEAASGRDLMRLEGNRTNRNCNTRRDCYIRFIADRHVNDCSDEMGRSVV